jgi:hypothetical protein
MARHPTRRLPTITSSALVIGAAEVNFAHRLTVDKKVT